MVPDRPCFRASTRPQHIGPNNKNKHPGVDLVPQCEDLNEEHVELPRHTVRGNPIPHSLFFSPLLLLPSPLSFLLTLVRLALHIFGRLWLFIRPLNCFSASLFLVRVRYSQCFSFLQSTENRLFRLFSLSCQNK